MFSEMGFGHEMSVAQLTKYLAEEIAYLEDNSRWYLKQKYKYTHTYKYKLHILKTTPGDIWDKIQIQTQIYINKLTNIN